MKPVWCTQQYCLSSRCTVLKPRPYKACVGHADDQIKIFDNIHILWKWIKIKYPLAKNSVNLVNRNKTDMHSSKKLTCRNHSTLKQTPKAVLTNRCSQNMLQVNRRILRIFMPEMHLNKVALQFAVNRITGSIKNRTKLIWWWSYILFHKVYASSCCFIYMYIYIHIYNRQHK